MSKIKIRYENGYWLLTYDGITEKFKKLSSIIHDLWVFNIIK